MLLQTFSSPLKQFCTFFVFSVIIIYVLSNFVNSFFKIF
nr:MAG TPA: hypothetical protein [Caudoviricetes sp.]